MSAQVRALHGPQSAPRARVEPATDRLAVAARLIRALAEAVLASVQHTTELNWQAARRLLAATQSPQLRQRAERSVQGWQLSWHAYLVCSTTAAEVLELTRAHVQSHTDELWRTLHDSGLTELPGVDAGHARELQQCTRDVQAAWAAYLDAVLTLRRRLMNIAQERP